MLNRLLHIISTLDTMQHDDWRDRLKSKNQLRLKIAIVLFAVVIVLCMLVRVIS